MTVRRGLPVLLALHAGFSDTAGFVALQGLFTAHVTGNFVTLAASLLVGLSGLVTKLLALPVFLVTVAGVAWLVGRLRQPDRALVAMFLLQAGLLSVVAALAITQGPFADPDSAWAVMTGLVAVAAMAIQNAAGRLFLSQLPPSTLMTGTSTQLAIDLTVLLTGRGTVPEGRARALVSAVTSFAAGCALAALGYKRFGMRLFLLPPVLTLAIAWRARRSGP